MPSRFFVHDRNRDGAILAGPFDTREEADTEKEQWAGATDPYVMESGEAEKPEDLEEAAESFSEGNPDEELAEAIEQLEPAAGEVAEAALDAGRPDLAEEVVSKTLETLADWAESAEELAETLEDVSEEIADEDAEEAADEAAEATEEAAQAVEDELESAGVEPAIAEMEVEPANGTEVMEEIPPMDIPPEPSHWLYRRRFRRVA